MKDKNRYQDYGTRLYNVPEYCTLTGLKKIEVYKLINENRLQALKYKGIISILI